MDENDVNEEEGVDESTDDSSSVDWKAKYEERGIKQRERTKALKDQIKELEGKVAKQSTQSSGKDFGKLAYLKGFGIEHEDDIAWIEEVSETTKQDLGVLLNKPYIQAELKERREYRTTANATPEASKRATTLSRDKAEYWIAKGEMPPKSDPKLRREVVRQRRETEGVRRKFHDS